MTLTDHPTHDEHPHQHGTGCGHASIEHAGHIDYLHDGHVHSQHADHWDECEPAPVERADQRQER